MSKIKVHTAQLHSVNEFIRAITKRQRISPRQASGNLLVHRPKYRLTPGQARGFRTWMVRKYHKCYVFNLKEYIPYLKRYLGVR